MALVTRTCITVQCDECADHYWNHLDYQPHWSTEDEALADLTSQGWRTTAGGLLLCAWCAAVLACRAEGHQFSSWQPCYCNQLDGCPTLPGHWVGLDGACAARWRSCDRCEGTEERLSPDVPNGLGGDRS